jgi:hypothetical protein
MRVRVDEHGWFNRRQDETGLAVRRPWPNKIDFASSLIVVDVLMVFARA